jgi:membrane protease YdiL (CAAX protease family)
LTSEDAAGAPAPAIAPRGASPSLLVPALVDFGLLVLVLVFFSVVLVAAVMVPGIVGLGADATSAGAEGLIEQSMPAVIVAAIAAMLLTALVIWGLRRKTLAPMPLPMATRPAYALAIVAGVLVQTGALAVLTLMSSLGAAPQTSNAQPLMELAQSAPWLTAILVVVAAPLAEELLFRHVLLRRFALAGRAGLGLLLTSLLFSLMHEPFPDGSPVLAWLAGLGLYVGMGIAFGLVYLRTGRLGAAFLAHAVCNLCATALMAYSGS